jgi:hypothetical protein
MDSIYWVAALFGSFLIWNSGIASAAVSTCVVKLEFSSDQSDKTTDAFAKQILDSEGYKVIDNWLFTIWSHSDYDVKINITHTESPNYGFPVSLMGMQLFIADASGKIVVNNYIDRANLEASLRAFIPACGASSQSGTNAGTGQEIGAQ